jgi:hypothetical protein
MRREADLIKRAQAREATARRLPREMRLGGGPDAGETMRRRQDLFFSLDRTISVELRDAPVQKAVEAMSTASGIPITVDPTVPSDKRLTVVAQVVSVKNILAEVARQTGLLIAPDRDAKGVVLRPLSSLQVNGTRVPFRAPNAPWSIEWDNLPVASQMLSIMAPRVVSGYSSFSTSAGGMKAGVVTLHAGLDGVALTGLGNDRFVVASPAPAGENGVMLTVYRLEGNQLRVVSSILHHFEGSAGTPRPVSANPAVVVPPQPPPRP